MVSSEVLRGLSALLNLPQRVRIADVGANPINPAPYDPLINSGLAEVWGFEPQPEAYEALKAIGRKDLHVLPYAIGDGRRHELRVCKGSGFTSLLEPSQAFRDYVNHFHLKMQVKERIKVDTHRLDDLAELPAIDMLKIDIQGGETMVFAHAGETLANAVAVVTEVAFVPLYEDQPLIDSQMRMLRGDGFCLHKFIAPMQVPLRGALQAPFGARHFRNQLTDGDAVFIRPIPESTDLASDKIKALAMLAMGAFDSVDVTLRCLDILVRRQEIAAEDARDWTASLGVP